jgi:hypothetical protein
LREAGVKIYCGNKDCGSYTPVHLHSFKRNNFTGACADGFDTPISWDNLDNILGQAFGLNSNTS